MEDERAPSAANWRVPVGAVLGAVGLFLVVAVLALFILHRRRRYKGIYVIEEDYEPEDPDVVHHLHEDMDKFEDHTFSMAMLSKYIPKVVLEHPKVSMSRV